VRRVVRILVACAVAGWLLGPTGRAEEGEARLLAALERGDADAATLLVETERIGVLREVLAARATRDDAGPSASFRREERDARAKEVAAWRAYRRAREEGLRAEVRSRRAELERAREAVRAALERLDRAAEERLSLDDPPAESARLLRRALAEDEVFVLYALPATEALAVVLTRDRARVVSLGPTKAIAEAVAALEWSRPDADPSEAVEGLRLRVLDPLGLPAECRVLVVAPDGPLWRVPFALLAPAREVARVPSAAVYALLREETRPAGSGVLAVGDPEFARGRLPSRFAPLPATREEAESVGDVVLLGPAAGVPTLLEALRGRPTWRALHVATHAVVNLEEPSLSALALAPSDEHDGLWTALDVAHGAISADLVVLSAADTAGGPVVAGRCVRSLAHAFLVAGVPRVIASLGSVDDDATRALMTRFHSLWKGGTPTARALKEAQAFVRSHDRWRHPAYWAAWVLCGLPE
jgi:CHAT domain-containing protein